MRFREGDGALFMGGIFPAAGRPDERAIVIHLGKCLAFVHQGAGFAASAPKRGNGAIHRSSLETVKERLDLLNSSGPDVLPGAAVPDRSCLVDRPFLEGNIDFFLLYLGIASIARSGCIDCARLMKHLNDCYRCFDVYCSTLQEYFIEKERLSRQKSV